MLPVGDSHPALDRPRGRSQRPLILGGVGAVLLTIVIAAIPSDDVAPRPARLPTKPMPASRNGFDFVAFTAGDIAWPTDPAQRSAAADTAEGRGFDRRLAEQLLADNQDALHRLRAALAASEFRVPAASAASVDNASVSAYIEWQKHLTKLIAVQAFSHQAGGLDDQAIDTALQILALGQRVEGGQGELADWCAGSQVTVQGLACVHRLLRQTKLLPPRLAHLVDRLGRFRADRDGLAAAYAAEQQRLLHFVDALAEGQADPVASYLANPESLPSDWRHTMLQAAPTRQALQTVFSRVRRIAEGPQSPDWQDLQTLTQNELRQLRSTGASANPIGIRICEENLGDALVRPLRLRCMQDTAVDALRALAAMHAFQQRQRRLPAGLAELAPFFVGRPPEDAFDGGPLRYDQVKRILYSVGADGVDAGGSSATDVDRARADTREPTFWIEF